MLVLSLNPHRKGIGEMKRIESIFFTNFGHELPPTIIFA